MKEELEKMAAELQQIQDFLDIEASDNPEELTERLSAMNVYLARSGKLMADAQYILAKEKDAVFSEFGSRMFNAPPSIVKELLAARTADASYVYLWAERINRTIVHAGDNIRTQVSYGKENLKLTRTGY